MNRRTALILAAFSCSPADSLQCISRRCALLALPTFPVAAHAAADGPVFDFSKPLSTDIALDRFQRGRQSLNYLLENYDEIVLGGGDNVRRYLGTVGTTSGLWGISKVLKRLRDEADDIVEFTDLENEVESAILAADGAAYMAIFVTTSSSSVPPQRYFEDARREAKVAKKFMDKVAVELGL